MTIPGVASDTSINSGGVWKLSGAVASGTTTVNSGGILSGDNGQIAGTVNILDKIRSFMSGPQKGIYDEVRAFLTAQDQNIAFIEESAADKLRKALADPQCLKGTVIQELKADFYALKERIEQTVLAERNAVTTAIDEVADKIDQTSELATLPSEQQARIRDGFAAQKAGLAAQSQILTLRHLLTEVHSNLLADTLTRLPPSNSSRSRPSRAIRALSSTAACRRSSGGGIRSESGK